MGVERPGEAEVVQHRCDVQQLEVDLEIRVVCIGDAPQVGANAVRVQRRGAVAAGNLVRCDCRRGVWTRQLVQVHRDHLEVGLGLKAPSELYAARPGRTAGFRCRLSAESTRGRPARLGTGLSVGVARVRLGEEQPAAVRPSP